MTRAASGGRGFKGACGVFTCLLLLACEPEPSVGNSPTDAQSPEVSQPPQAQPTGRSWYVSPKGSDGAKGTQEAPLRTIGRAVALAGPGEVIRVLPGVYPEELVLESRGSQVAPITLRGEGSPRPSLVPAGRTHSTVLRVQGRWNLENLHIDVGGAPMFAVIFDPKAEQSVLRDSELNGGTSGAGVFVQGARNITVQNNSIHHFIKSGDDSHGVVVVAPARNIIIRDNDIHHDSGDSVQCQAETDTVENILIEGNTLHDEGENAVDIKGCEHVIVRDNTLGGFPNTAVRPPGSSAGEAIVLHEAVHDILIEGNDISRAGRGVSVLGEGAPSEFVWIRGNHFQDIRNLPDGNGQAIRIESARNIWVEDNTVEDTASYGLMLAADGVPVEGLVVRNNTLKGGTRPFLLRLGPASSRPGALLERNRYVEGGILKADGLLDQLTLSSPEKLDVWQQALGGDEGATLLK